MLTALQISLLAQAYARSEDLLLQIFALAAQNNDLDTVLYIMENYAQKYSAQQQQVMREVTEVVYTEILLQMQIEDTTQMH